MTHDVDLAAAYLLDALEPAEAEEFNAHLATCDECRREVAELRQVVGALPLAVEPIEPPAGLRDRVLGAARDETPEPAVVPFSRDHEGRPTKRRNQIAWVLGGLAAALILGLAVWNLQLQHGGNAQAALAVKVENAILQGAPVRHIPGTASAPRATAAVVQPRGSVSYLVVRGLPATPANRVYQVWLIRGTKPVSAGVFRYSGSDPMVVPLPIRAAGFAATAVTVEPGPHGMPAPTGPKLLLGSLGT